MKNILFATTRQWNPGDEFILFGIINLFKQILGSFNPIIYNRNPQTRMTFQNKLEVPLGEDTKAHIDMNGLWGSFTFTDNSHSTVNSLKHIDYIVFAGSPEWRSQALVPLYEQIAKENRFQDVMYLGIGSAEAVPAFDSLPEVVKNCLLNGRLVTVRDRPTERLLEPAKAIKLPCPALFASEKETERHHLGCIGITIGSPCQIHGQNTSKEVFEYTKEIYELLKKDEQVKLISHYCQEIEYILDEIDTENLHYSFDAKDYLDIYNNCKFVVSTRIHGAGIAASLGIPSILIDHTSRTDTARGFLSEIVSLEHDPQYVVDLIKAVDFKSLSQRVIAHKEINKDAYLALLKKAVS